jgi:hypothetical protein
MLIVFWKCEKVEKKRHALLCSVCSLPNVAHGLEWIMVENIILNHYLSLNFKKIKNDEFN